MNYKLALKLQEAGFPQESWDFLALGEPFKKPTLEELIEACGVSFGRLDHVLVEGNEAWVAYSSKIENEINVPAYIFQQGSTSTEAVANLWLALNKK